MERERYRGWMQQVLPDKCKKKRDSVNTKKQRASTIMQTRELGTRAIILI